MRTGKFFQWSIILVACFAVVYFFVLRPCIGPVCVTKNVPFLSSLIEGDRPVDFYEQKADSLIVILVILLSFVFLAAPFLKRLVVSFFLEKDFPWNLAIFRIVFFAFILLRFDEQRVVWFSHLPPELIIPPFGCAFLLKYIPINATLADIFSDVFVVSCIFAMIGLLTRTSCWIALITGWYVFGIPQFYGKVDHTHHLLWFMAIFVSSACADVLSIDSVFKGIRRADQGYKLVPIENSVKYALPLRFIWFLMGIVYFFPGLWKALKSQWHWAFSDNLRNIMYAKWFELSGWTPAFRIDQHPWIYTMAGLGTMIFELAFIGLVLVPSLRWGAVTGGLMFHNMTNMFMRIPFIHLQMCYLSFLNWAGIFNWLGKNLFKKDLFVIYDGNCKICRRTIAILQRFDIFSRIVYVNAMDQQQLDAYGLIWIDPVDLVKDMHVVIGKNKWKGFEAYRVLAVRIPLFWPVWLLLWVWPVPQLGKIIYRKVADSRLCSIRKAQPPLEDGQEALNANLWIKWIGTSLIIVELLFGLAHQPKSWPFACYPTFDGIAERPEIEIISFMGVRNGQEELIDIEIFKKRMASQKYAGLIGQITRDKNEERKKIRLSKLFEAMSKSGVDIKNYSKVRFYTTVRSTVPEKYSDDPISRKLLFETEINGS